jgi:hypothetical protein
VRSLPNGDISPGLGGAESGRRWASKNLAIITLSIGWQPHWDTGRTPADASAVNALEATEMQLIYPATKFLVGSPELWKFR